MNFPTKTVLINVGLAIIFSVMIAVAFGNLSRLFFAFGSTGLFDGLIDFMTGLIL